MSRSTSWLFSKPTVREYVRDGVLHLESHGHLLSMSDFHVRVPAGVAVEVSESAADVDVLGAPGSVTVDTSAGDVRVDVTRAPHRITVDTDAGDVHVGVPAGEYAVRVHAGAGDEDVHGIVRNDRAEKSIHVRTDAGDIEVERR